MISHFFLYSALVYVDSKLLLEIKVRTGAQISHSYNYTFLRLSDIRSRCGPDASVYLKLEIYLVILLSVVSLLSLGVILPINYTAGGLGSSKDVFPRTTISNVPSE